MKSKITNLVMENIKSDDYKTTIKTFNGYQSDVIFIKAKGHWMYYWEGKKENFMDKLRIIWLIIKPSFVAYKTTVVRK